MLRSTENSIIQVEGEEEFLQECNGKIYIQDNYEMSTNIPKIFKKWPKTKNVYNFKALCLKAIDVIRKFRYFYLNS